jgi:hypothetical protein
MSTFNPPPDLEQITLAKSSDINAIVAATKAAFDLLPEGDDLKTGAINYAQTSAGSANSYAVTMKDPDFNFYQDGMQVIFKPVASNTGGSTINVNSLGAKSIVLNNGNALGASDISINAPITLRYSSNIISGGAFVIEPNSANYAGVATTQAGIATTKAGEAATSATNAASSASSAASSASAASSSASAASTSAANAANSASSMTESVNTCTTKAGEASTSATNSAESATDSVGNALEASNWAKLLNALVPIYNESTNSTSTSGSDYSAKEYAVGTTVESAKRHASGTVSTGSAKDWATKTASEVVSGQGFGALKYANDAAASASSASTSAETATTQAGIATTKAGEAATSATTASTKASEASTSETNAAGSATTATTQAGIATTKASEAAASAVDAANSLTSATSVLSNTLSINNDGEMVVTPIAISFTGITKSDGTSFVQAVAGTDYVVPAAIQNKSATYAVIASDSGKIINSTSGSYTVSLTSAATLGAGFNCSIWNSSSTSTDVITIDPSGSETIDGMTTIVLRRGEGLDVISNGTNWEVANKKTMRGYAENFINTLPRPKAIGSNSIAFGQSKAEETGKITFGHAANINYVKAQSGKIILTTQWDGATAFPLVSDGVDYLTAASETNQLIIKDGQAVVIQGTLIARAFSTGAIAAYNITGAATNFGGTITATGLALTLIGTDLIGLGAAPTITVDSVNKAIKITSGYKSGTNIRWAATINTTEVSN